MNALAQVADRCQDAGQEKTPAGFVDRNGGFFNGTMKEIPRPVGCVKRTFTPVQLRFEVDGLPMSDTGKEGA